MFMNGIKVQVQEPISCSQNRSEDRHLRGVKVKLQSFDAQMASSQLCLSSNVTYYAPCIIQSSSLQFAPGLSFSKTFHDAALGLLAHQNQHQHSRYKNREGIKTSERRH